MTEASKAFEIETVARTMCFEHCSKGGFLDFENGCCTVCKSPSECQSWRVFDTPARAALSQESL